MRGSLVARTCRVQVRVRALVIAQSDETGDALVSVGDLLTVHARREEEDEGGDGDEEQCDVAIVHEGVLQRKRSVRGTSPGHEVPRRRARTHDGGEDKDDVGEVRDDGDQGEQERCGGEEPRQRGEECGVARSGWGGGGCAPSYLRRCFWRLCGHWVSAYASMSGCQQSRLAVLRSASDVPRR